MNPCASVLLRSANVCERVCLHGDEIVCRCQVLLLRFSRSKLMNEVSVETSARRHCRVQWHKQMILPHAKPFGCCFSPPLCCAPRCLLRHVLLLWSGFLLYVIDLPWVRDLYEKVAVLSSADILCTDRFPVSSYMCLLRECFAHHCSADCILHLLRFVLLHQLLQCVGLHRCVHWLHCAANNLLVQQEAGI